MGIADIISLLGGLGFFLFGMSLLGDGLKKVAGNKLEMILAKLTSTTLKGVLLGTFVTAVIQSSSATSVMVVGFVNSGIMKLTNAIGIVMGANIGTTATGWILTLAGVEGKGVFSSATMFALIAFIGIILYFFCKGNTQKSIGLIMLAFSVLMSGMQSMSGAMSGLKTSPVFLNFITAVENPLVSFVVGVIVTAIIQSCSASIGILQALSVTGVISYEVAIPMVLGMCVGACVPVLLSAIGANVNGKRTAFVYLYFNLAGCVILVPAFYILHAIIDFGFVGTMATSLGIAIVNTVYKVGATVILTPFAGVLEKVAVLTIKDKSSDDDEIEEVPLDSRLLNYPSTALEQSGKSLDQMSAAAFKNLSKSIELLYTFNQEKHDKIMSREDKVDRFEDRLGAYLVQVNTKELTAAETRVSAKYLHCLNNLERVSDHAVNLADLAQEMHQKHITFSAQAEREIRICSGAVCEIAALARSALSENNLALARKVEPLEEVIDALTEEMKVRHIQRVQAGACTLELGFIFNDCINNFERVADHCSNIAVAVLEAADSNVHAHDYLRTVKQNDQAEYHNWLKHYENLYLSLLMSHSENAL